MKYKLAALLMVISQSVFANGLALLLRENYSLGNTGNNRNDPCKNRRYDWLGTVRVWWWHAIGNA